MLRELAPLRTPNQMSSPGRLGDDPAEGPPLHPLIRRETTLGLMEYVLVWWIESLGLLQELEEEEWRYGVPGYSDDLYYQSSSE